MLLDDLLDRDKLIEDINAGYISVRPHPLDPALVIYNYTRAAAYDNYWTHETRTCRGLIVDHGVVVARPFEKFHNYGEHLTNELLAPIPLDQRFAVKSKEDGSLGVFYMAPDGPAIATRGSFESEQALWATEHLRASYPTYRPAPGSTACFEIIYPANRIVLDYGDVKDLIHLATLDNYTNLEVPEYWWDGPRAKTYPFDRFEDLKSYVEREQADNREGFVVNFEHGLRIKLKFEEYVALHRVLTGLSEKRIWEHLGNEGNVRDFIDAVPDEFDEWVHSVVERLVGEAEAILRRVFAKTDEIEALGLTRKEIAFRLADDPERSWVFSALDGKIDRLIDQVWKSLEPVGSVTFRDDPDEA